MKPRTTVPVRQSLEDLSPRLRKVTEPDPAAPRPQGQANRDEMATTGNARLAVRPGNASRSDRYRASKKLTVRIPEELADRARSAWRLESAEPGSPYPTFSGWIVTLIEDAVIDAENRWNDGQPFPPTPAGTIPTGRPTR